VAAGIGYAGWTVWNDPTLADLPADVQLLPAATSLVLKLTATLIAVGLWLALLRGLGGRVPARDAYRIYLVSGLAKYLPGKVAHIAGRVALLCERGAPAPLGLTSVLLELALSVLSSALVSLIALPLLLGRAGPTDRLAAVAWFAALAVPIGLVGLHPRVLGPALRLGSRLMPKAGAAVGSRLPPYRTTLLLLAAYAALSGIGALALLATARTVYPLEAHWLPFLAGVATTSHLLGIVVPVAPAGIGAREALMAVLLATIMPAPAAALTSVLSRTLSILADLLATGLSLAVTRLTRLTRQAPGPAAASPAPPGPARPPTRGGS
jgi:hypothetical protein